MVAQQALIEEKIVRAPFAGRLGIRQVDLGQYLAAGTTVVTLQALDPILIDFYVPQQALKDLQDRSRPSTANGRHLSRRRLQRRHRVDQFQGRHREPQRAGARLVQERRSAAGARHVRERRDRFRRGDDADHPAADRHHLQPLRRHGLCGASTAGRATASRSDTVQQRFVKLGATRGDQVAVLSGVNAGDVVVSAGQMKLRNGTAVVINNAVQPTDEPNPTPPNE